jgi:hypothetical protein
MSVDEIYDVKVLDNLKRPSILSPSMPAVKNSIVTPEHSFWKTAYFKIIKTENDEKEILIYNRCKTLEQLTKSVYQITE